MDKYQAERLMKDLNMLLNTDEIEYPEFEVILKNYVDVD